MSNHSVESGSNKSEPDDDFDNNLPKTVTLLKHEKTGAKVYLIGTAHFSKESQADVVKVITIVIPNVVVLELCSSRSRVLTIDEETLLQEAKQIDFQKIMTVIKTNGTYNGLMYLILLNMSVSATKQLGMAPGGEFRVAFKEANKIPNCNIILGDRPIIITLKRASTRLSWFQLMKLVWNLLTTNISAEEVEKMKDRDLLEQVLGEGFGPYPALREVLLDERDIYLTHSLQAAAVDKSKQNDSSEPIRIVGVVGIGHVPGIIRLWPEDQAEFVEAIVQIPPPSVTSTIIKLTFKVSLLVFVGYLGYKYVPVPNFFKIGARLCAQKIIHSIRAENTFKLNIN